MHKTAFDSSYTGVTADGAQWLVDHLPGLQLLGIDYTSIALYEDLPGAHNVLLPRVSCMLGMQSHFCSGDAA